MNLIIAFDERTWHFFIQIRAADMKHSAMIATRNVLQTVATQNLDICTWAVQVVRYPNFFFGNGSR